MRGLLRACAALFALGVGTANAADLPIWTAGRTGPVMLPFTWAGPYFGLNIGGQWTSDTVSTISAGPGFFAGEAQSLDAMSRGTVNAAGAIGGMQAGYNWQFDQAVVGLEVDFNGATATGNRSIIGIFNSPPGTGLTTTVKQPMFISTVRPRVGWTFDHLMVYATGGYAFATYQVVDSFNFTVGQPGNQADVTAKLSGWTAGAGVEYAFYKGMSLKLEYLYLGMGTFTTNIGSPATIAQPTNINVRHSLSDNIIRLGLNFHFGWY
jgi:outer membrane immunogenic protein